MRQMDGQQPPERADIILGGVEGVYVLEAIQILSHYAYCDTRYAIAENCRQYSFRF
jgi:hypothetical protein